MDQLQEYRERYESYLEEIDAALSTDRMPEVERVCAACPTSQIRDSAAGWEITDSEWPPDPDLGDALLAGEEVGTVKPKDQRRTS